MLVIWETSGRNIKIQQMRKKYLKQNSHSIPTTIYYYYILF